MAQGIERTIEELRVLLPYVANDAARFGSSSELIEKSHEFHLAVRAINETLPHPSLASMARGPLLQIRIGTRAVDALTFRKIPYDFLEAEETLAQPGEVHDLRYSHHISTDTLAPRIHKMPVYGQRKYFDLATLGRTLKDGGELSLSE